MVAVKLFCEQLSLEQWTLKHTSNTHKFTSHFLQPVTVPSQSSCWPFKPVSHTHAGNRQLHQATGRQMLMISFCSICSVTLSKVEIQQTVSLRLHVCKCVCQCVQMCMCFGWESSMYTHKHPPGDGSHPGNIYLCC